MKKIDTNSIKQLILSMGKEFEVTLFVNQEHTELVVDKLLDCVDKLKLIDCSDEGAIRAALHSISNETCVFTNPYCASAIVIKAMKHKFNNIILIVDPMLRSYRKSISDYIERTEQFEVHVKEENECALKENSSIVKRIRFFRSLGTTNNFNNIPIDMDFMLFSKSKVNNWIEFIEVKNFVYLSRSRIHLKPDILLDDSTICFNIKRYDSIILIVNEMTNFDDLVFATFTGNK